MHGILGDGEGNFSEVNTFISEQNDFKGRFIRAVDLNNDSHLDLVIGKLNKISIYYNTSNISSVSTPSENEKEVRLRQNFPNPFRSNTTICFDLAKSNQVTITVFEHTGKKVSKIFDEWLIKDSYCKSFENFELPEGVYFYQIKSGKDLQIKKMIVAK